MIIPSTPVFECAACTTSYPNVGILTWSGAHPNQQVSTLCPHGGSATRRCRPDNTWAEPDLARCLSAVSERVTRVLEEEGDQTDKIKRVVVEEVNSFSPRDVEQVVLAISNISPADDTVRLFYTCNLMQQNFLSILRNLNRSLRYGNQYK